MILGKPACFVHAFIEAVDAAIREHQPDHAMSVTQATKTTLTSIGYSAPLNALPGSLVELMS